MADLQPLNTLRLQARSRWLCTAANDAGVLAAVEYADKHSLAVHVLGEGSNVVLAPWIDGVVLRPNRDDVTWQAHGRRIRVTAGAGVGWHGLVMASVRRGLWGIENLALIPGSVGAAPVQNVGAYGRELAETFVELWAVDLVSGRVARFDRQACGFGYRDSVFRRADRTRWLITRVTLELDPAGRSRLDYPGVREALGEGLPAQEKITPYAVARAVIALRRRKLPAPEQAPNAGSFFKNPVVSREAYQGLCRRWPGLPGFAVGDHAVKVSAAWLIERCGWKGRRRGAFAVAERHALVLVHEGGGDAQELLVFAEAIRRDVMASFGIALELEPRVIGRAPAT